MESKFDYTKRENEVLERHQERIKLFCERWNLFRMHNTSALTMQEWNERMNSKNMPYRVHMIRTLKKHNIFISSVKGMWRFAKETPIPLHVVEEAIQYQRDVDKKRRHTPKVAPKVEEPTIEDTRISLKCFTNAELAKELRDRGFELIAIRHEEL